MTVSNTNSTILKKSNESLASNLQNSTIRRNKNTKRVVFPLLTKYDHKDVWRKNSFVIIYLVRKFALKLK